MQLPRFSEMIVDRRRSLGFTIDQAARVLRMKDEVLIAFEEGDFERMPKSGYAQGMLSSYARYLGLNPRVVVDQFCEDLFEYEHGTHSHELRRRSRDSRNASAWEQAISGSTTTSEPRVSHERYQSYSTPLVDRAAPPAFSLPVRPLPLYDESERYSKTRSRVSSPRGSRRQTQARKRQQNRSIQPSSRRRSSDNLRTQRGRRPSSAAGNSFLSNLSEDPRKLIVLGCVVALIVLVLISIITVSSCVRNRNEQGNEYTVEETSHVTEPSETPEHQLEAEAEALTQARQRQNPTETKNTKVTVEVEVLEGAISWVEIVSDERSALAETVTGPWTQSFDVKKSLTIQVNNTQSVIVRRNGIQLHFEPKASGIGMLVIDGADPNVDLNAPAADESSAASDEETLVQTSEPELDAGLEQNAEAYVEEETHNEYSTAEDGAYNEYDEADEWS